jgi:hypothetical protein
MLNKYSGPCAICGGHVPAKGGTLVGDRPRKPAHLACAETGEAQVFSLVNVFTGEEYFQNKRGRCIDAPCCGCCNF